MVARLHLFKIEQGQPLQLLLLLYHGWLFVCILLYVLMTAFCCQFHITAY